MMERSPITLVPYDLAWPERFEVERQALRSLLSPLDVTIEHIGSTAVPGLSAKPTIDLMLGCGQMAEFAPCIPALETHGWEYLPKLEKEFPGRRFLAKPKSRPRQFHLHAVEIGSEFWKRHLAFRDYLRRHPEMAASYDQLKRALAAEFTDDRESYTGGKAAFIDGVLRRADAEARALQRAGLPRRCS